MSRDDDKFAWLKTHPLCARLRELVRDGQPIPYDELVRATDPGGTGATSMQAFSTGSSGSEKGLYTIFQYAVVLQRADGRVALFERVGDDKGHGKRNVAGRSLLVSGSRMMTPTDALESIFEDKLSFGRKGQAGEIEPLGFALLKQFRHERVERADYLFALYRVRMSTNRLNGLVRENPDSFHGWVAPAEIHADALGGAVDRVLLESVLTPATPAAVTSGSLLYHPACRLVDAKSTQLEVEPFEVNEARTVFVSHDADAQLKAFLLRDVMIKRSRRRLYPILDTHEVLPSGEPVWALIERHIDRADVLLVLVTAGARQSRGVEREIAYAMRAARRPEIVVLQVDGTDDDVPLLVRNLNRIDYRGRNYRMWHKELGGLIQNLRERPFRPGTQ